MHRHGLCMLLPGDSEEDDHGCDDDFEDECAWRWHAGPVLPDVVVVVVVVMMVVVMEVCDMTAVNV